MRATAAAVGPGASHRGTQGGDGASAPWPYRRRRGAQEGREGGQGGGRLVWGHIEILDEALTH